MRSDAVWRDVPGFPGYEVSEYGDMRRGTKYLKGRAVSADGRKGYALSRNGRVTVYSAAKWVALAFIGPMPFDGAEACHNDSFSRNDHYSNLRWDTGESNAADRAEFAVKTRLRLVTDLDKSRAALAVEAARLVAAARRPRAKRFASR